VKLRYTRRKQTRPGNTRYAQDGNPAGEFTDRLRYPLYTDNQKLANFLQVRRERSCNNMGYSKQIKHRQVHINAQEMIWPLIFRTKNRNTDYR